MAEYRLSPAAERDLEGIWKYTRAKWGAEQAERYTDLLTAAFEELAESPKSASACAHKFTLPRWDSRLKKWVDLEVTGDKVGVIAWAYR